MRILRNMATAPWRAVLHLGPAAFAAAVMLGAPSTQAQSGPPAGTGVPRAPQVPAFPDFDVAPCCQLCPVAADRRAYSTSFLSSFVTLVQGRNGWLFRTDDDLRTDFSADPQAQRELRRLHDTLAAQGTELVVMLQPPRGLMHRDELPNDRALYNPQLARFSYVRTLQELRNAGMVVPNFERLVYEGGHGSFYFRDDHHWRPEGARRMAEVVAETVRELPLYASLPKTEFVTGKVGLFAKRGTMARAAQQLCGYGAPEQYVVQYATVPAEEGGADALFGEDAPPPITLVGTSNSDPVYNFAGFLQEFLKVDVLNASVVGGGLDGSMLSYFNSAEYRDSPPRLMLWEIAPYHNLSDHDFYRQAIPLATGGCERRPSVLSESRALKPGRNEVLFNAGKTRTLRGGDHTLDLRFSEAPGELHATVWYTNGRDEGIRMEGFGDGTRYVFELRSDDGYGELGFLSLDVNVDQTRTTPLQLEARMCNRHAPPAVTVTARSGEQP